MATSDGHAAWFEWLLGVGTRPGSDERPRWSTLVLTLQSVPLMALCTHLLLADPPNRLFVLLMSWSFGLFMAGAGLGYSLRGRDGRRTSRVHWWIGTGAVLCVVAGGAGGLSGLVVLLL